jgi:hypothetical protein
MPDHAGRVTALLLAAGLGTRLRPLTDTIPKCLVPIAGRPLLDFWVEGLAEAGIATARINTHAQAEQVRAYIEGVNALGRLRLVASHEPELLGSAGTVAANADLADDAEDVVIIYADNFSDIDLRPFRRRLAPLDVLLGRDRVQRSQIIKQADVLMMILLLWDRLSPQVREANFRYYEPRTDHGSSLSPPMHALYAARLGLPDLAEKYFLDAGRAEVFREHLGSRVFSPAPEGDGQDVLDWLRGVRALEER